LTLTRSHYPKRLVPVVALMLALSASFAALGQPQPTEEPERGGILDKFVGGDQGKAIRPPPQSEKSNQDDIVDPHRPSGWPGRIVFGQTAELDNPGVLRLSLHELLLYRGTSFVPLDNLELSLGGFPLDSLAQDGLMLLPMVRYRLVALDSFQIAVGAGWAGVPYPLFPFTETSLTAIWGPVRVNLCGRYVFLWDSNPYLAEREWSWSNETVWSDDVMVSLGIEWRAAEFFGLFIEGTLFVPTFQVDYQDRPDDGWSFDLAAVNSLLVVPGFRFVLGRWNFDVGVINTDWDDLLVFPWFVVGSAFNLY